MFQVHTTSPAGCYFACRDWYSGDTVGNIAYFFRIRQFLKTKRDQPSGKSPTDVLVGSIIAILSIAMTHFVVVTLTFNAKMDLGKNLGLLWHAYNIIRTGCRFYKLQPLVTWDQPYLFATIFKHFIYVCFQLLIFMYESQLKLHQEKHKNNQ